VGEGGRVGSVVLVFGLKGSGGEFFRGDAEGQGKSRRLQRQDKQQIPFGDDNKKSKSKGTWGD
jgi:hypothetical protein